MPRLCRLSQPLPSLTHVTQLVRAVFCLSLHSDTPHLKACASLCKHTDPLTIHTEPGSRIFCQVRRWVNKRTDFSEAALTSSHALPRRFGLPWRQNPTHTMQRRCHNTQPHRYLFPTSSPCRVSSKLSCPPLPQCAAASVSRQMKCDAALFMYSLAKHLLSSSIFPLD